MEDKNVEDSFNQNYLSSSVKPQRVRRASEPSLVIERGWRLSADLSFDQARAAQWGDTKKS